MGRIGARTICLLFAATFGVAGCNPIYYSPTNQNVLMAPAQGDVALAGVTGDGRFELQAGYAVSEAIALQLNGGIFDRDEEDSEDGGSGNFLEVGASYTWRVDERVSWEVVGLLGAGSVENDFPSTVPGNPDSTGKLRASLLRFGVQPALGYRSKYFEAAASSRFVGLAYRNVEGSLIYQGEDQAVLLSDANFYFLVEPALTLRAGLENVKLQIQTSRSFNLTDPDFRQDEAMLTLGVVVGLSRKR